MAFEVTIPAFLAQQGINMYNAAELGRTKPAAVPAKDNYEILNQAAEKRAKSIAPDSSDLLIGLKETYPVDNKIDFLAAAGNHRVNLSDGRQGHMIGINPNVDAAYYAHELGHAVTDKTKVGNFVRSARNKLHSNPKLGRALAMALTGAVPTIGAALQEGDDDLAGSIGLAAAMASPTLVDEALASKNALAIMKDAGIRANMAQRGRLAGGYLSYLAPVIIAGSVGNALGNLADDHTALYDL